MAKVNKVFKITKDPMTIDEAVFNGHINGADKFTRKLMAKVFPEHLERLKEIEKEGNGIMHIFNVPLEPATTFYAVMVTALVNIKTSENPA